MQCVDSEQDRMPRRQRGRQETQASYTTNVHNPEHIAYGRRQPDYDSMHSGMKIRPREQCRKTLHSYASINSLWCNNIKTRSRTGEPQARSGCRPANGVRPPHRGRTGDPRQGRTEGPPGRALRFQVDAVHPRPPGRRPAMRHAPGPDPTSVGRAAEDREFNRDQRREFPAVLACAEAAAHKCGGPPRSPGKGRLASATARGWAARCPALPRPLRSWVLAISAAPSCARSRLRDRSVGRSRRPRATRSRARSSRPTG